LSPSDKTAILRPVTTSPRAHLSVARWMENTMAPKRKKKSSNRRRRPNTALVDHKRVGKKALSPMGSIPMLKGASWIQDQLPNYIWSCFHLVEDLDRGLRITSATLDLVNETLDSSLGNTPKERPALDGSLWSWEDVPESARGAVLADLQDRDAFDVAVPEEFAH